VDAILALSGLAVVHLLAVASPGPSTVLVVQTAAVSGRRGGLIAAFRHDAGRPRLGGGGALRTAGLFAQFAWLYRVFQIAGGLFLVYLAVMIWRHARDPLPEIASVARGSDGQIFVRALLLQLGNPKIMVFFGSIFLSILPQDLPAGCRPSCWRSWLSTNSPGSRCLP
jgi:threonine/homoserine/homoserine lactone efflux protein